MHFSLYDFIYMHCNHLWLFLFRPFIFKGKIWEFHVKCQGLCCDSCGQTHFITLDATRGFHDDSFSKESLNKCWCDFILKTVLFHFLFYCRLFKPVYFINSTQPPHIPPTPIQSIKKKKHHYIKSEWKDFCLVTILFFFLFV